MSVTEQDIELCDQYLDHALTDAEARQIDERLAGDGALRDALDRLRGQRAVRLEAMSTAFDTDAASIERLVGSVRSAQAAESARRSRTWWRPSRTAMAAAASIAFGVIVGGVIQGRQGGRWTATPAAVSEPTRIVAGDTVGVGMSGHGAYVVSLLDATGRATVKVRFNSADAARRFVESANKGNAGSLNVGDARVLDESY